MEDYPLDEFLEGTQKAWVMAVGPWVAGFVGILLGIAVVGYWSIEWHYWALYALLFPCIIVLDVCEWCLPTLFFAASIIAATIGFWFADRHRLEWLFILCLLVFANCLYFAGIGSDRIVATVLAVDAVVALYICLRLGRIRRWLADRKQVGE